MGGGTGGGSFGSTYGGRTTKTNNTSPYKLTKTHKLTLSKKNFSNLLKEIKKNGITEPIKYVEYKGTKYVVDGHHRLEAAKNCSVQTSPC